MQTTSKKLGSPLKRDGGESIEERERDDARVRRVKASGREARVTM